MSLFDDYLAALTELGGALVSAAASTTVTSGPDATGTTPAQYYLAAKIDADLAAQMMRFAVTQTAERAAQIAQAAGHVVEVSKQKLDAEVLAVEQGVESAYNSALDLGKRAVEGASNVVVAGTKQVLFTVELQLLVAAALLGGYFWYQSRKSGTSNMRQRAALAEV